MKQISTVLNPVLASLSIGDSDFLPLDLTPQWHDSGRNFSAKAAYKRLVTGEVLLRGELSTKGEAFIVGEKILDLPSTVSPRHSVMLTSWGTFISGGSTVGAVASLKISPVYGTGRAGLYLQCLPGVAVPGDSIIAVSLGLDVRWAP